MVPMADNMNHNAVDINVEIVNLQKQTEKETSPNYYRKLKFMTDFSDLFKSINTNDNYNFDLNSLNIKGRFNREAFAHNQERLSTKQISV